MARNKKAEKKFNKRLQDAVAYNVTKICIPRPDPAQGVPIWDSKVFMRELLAGRNNTVVQGIIDFLGYHEPHHYYGYGPEDVKTFNAFVTSVIAAFTFPGFTVPGNMVPNLISIGHIFSSIVASSAYETTDIILRQCIAGGDLVKLAFAQNARCKIQANVHALFDSNVQLASLWYNTYLLGAGCPTALMQSNLRKHIDDIDDRWEPINESVSCPMFTCTYMNQTGTKKFKTILNNAIKSKGLVKGIVNNPDPLSVAIITSKWHRNHAVYKSAGPLVEQLLGKYKLTLIHLGEQVPGSLVREGFDSVHHAYFKNHKLILPDALLKNDFQLAYFPDIGMMDEGIWISNARVAPIQACGYGHPDTTGCSEIDYFVGGDVEKDCADWYTEKLVLIPGLAQHPAIPTAPRQHNWVPSEQVRVNCVWGPDKYNYDLLQAMAEVNKRCGTQGHTFYFYPSPGINRYACVPPFLRDIANMLPNVVVRTDIEYYDYMIAAEQGDFSINSFPFGGYNTVVESFYMGLPCVAWEGNRFYNRAGSELIKRINMDDLTTTDKGEFVSIICKMIQDKEFLAAKRAQLATVDLHEKLFTVGPKHFLHAIDHIIANHPLTTNPTLIGELYDDSE
jgi:hypothetical protein